MECYISGKMSALFFGFMAVLFINKTWILFGLNSAMIFHLGNIFLPLWNKDFTTVSIGNEELFSNHSIRHYSVLGLCSSEEIKLWGYSLFFSWKKGEIFLEKRHMAAWYIILHLGRDSVIRQLSVVNSS